MPDASIPWPQDWQAHAGNKMPGVLPGPQHASGQTTGAADTRENHIIEVMEAHHAEVKARLNVLEEQVTQLVKAVSEDGGSERGKGSWGTKGSDADSVGKGSMASSSTTPRPARVGDCSWHGPIAQEKIHAGGSRIAPGDVHCVSSWSSHWWSIFSAQGEEAFATAATSAVENAIGQYQATVYWAKTQSSRFLAIECAGCGMGASLKYAPDDMKPKITKKMVENGIVPKYRKAKRELCDFLKLPTEHGYDPDDEEELCH